MSFSVKVTLSPADAKKFAEQGYHLALNKGPKDQTPKVQWLAIPVQGEIITVSWQNEYQIYFSTVSELEEGTVITQATYAEGRLGNSYAYKNTQFSTTGSAASGSIIIRNDNTTKGSFGLAQRQAGSNTYVPLAIQKLYENGAQATYTPEETVTLYFTKTNTQGIITSNQTTPKQVTVPNGRLLELKYNNGLWTTGSFSSFFDTPSSHSSVWDFDFILSGDINAGAVLEFLEAQIGKQYVIRSLSAKGSTIKVEVYGEHDPTEKIIALRGTITSTSKTLVATDHWAIDGTEVAIVNASPASTRETTLWNLVHAIAKDQKKK